MKTRLGWLQVVPATCCKHCILADNDRQCISKKPAIKPVFKPHLHTAKREYAEVKDYSNVC